jgi:hypothetical protein
MRKVMIIALTAGLVGCAPQIKQTWLRTDGQFTRNKPALEQQFQVDSAICDGETQRANVSGGTQFCRGAIGCGIADAQRSGSLQTVAKGCMAQHGYVLVPETEVEERAASFRAAHVQAPAR